MKIPADYQASSDLLKDRVILITGAGDGIGKAAAFLNGIFDPGKHLLKRL